MKANILKCAATFLIPASLLVFNSCSSTSEDQGGMRGGAVIDTVTTTVTVQSINASDRTVVLRRADGSLTTYKCGPDVRNFDQIAVGDQVKVTLAEEVALILVKGGMAPAAAQGTAIVRAPSGAKPGGQIIDTVGFTAKVMAVDAAQRHVSLQMVDGQTKIVKVGPNINLAQVKPGDDVGVRLTQALAISVEKPPVTAPK